MPICNVRKQTPKEFNGYFKDVLQTLIRRTFSPNDVLLFITYQPEVLTLDPNQVREHTAKLFHKYKYVETLEQTFKKSNRYNDSNYTGGYHSHILIKETDFNSIEGQFNELDIVKKVVYDLDGLTNRYLAKQAGELYEQLLPTSNIPAPSKEQINNHHPQTKALKETWIVSKNKILPKCFRETNKIDWIHMFVDDT